MNKHTNAQMHKFTQADNSPAIPLTAPLYTRLAANLKIRLLDRHHITLTPEAITIPTEQGARALAEIILYTLAPAGRPSKEAGLAHHISRIFNLHHQHLTGEHRQLRQDSLALYKH